MKEALDQLSEGLQALGGDDPLVRGIALLVTGLAAVGGLAWTVLRKRPERIRINAVVPPDQEVTIQTRKRGE